MSDPSANPIAYHHLTLGYFAHALTRLRRTTPATRGALVRMARGTLTIIAPDGEAAYWGRSQGQAWTLVLGAYAGLTAMALTWLAQTAPTVAASQPAQLKAGFGRVETISAVPQSAGAGSTSVGDSRRLGVRMEDGTFQYVDTPAGNVRVGDRVQFTSDGYIRHPVP